MTSVDTIPDGLPNPGETATLKYSNGQTEDVIVTGYSEAFVNIKFSPEQPDEYSHIVLSAFEKLIIKD